MTSRPTKSQKNKIGTKLSTLTREQALAYVGKRGRVCFLDKVSFAVRIVDYERQYGHHRWLVEPITGEGRAWLANVDLDAAERGAQATD
jgi:hypothetical protein